MSVKLKRKKGNPNMGLPTGVIDSTLLGQVKKCNTFTLPWTPAYNDFNWITRPNVSLQLFQQYAHHCIEIANEKFRGIGERFTGIGQSIYKQVISYWKSSTDSTQIKCLQDLLEGLNDEQKDFIRTIKRQPNIQLYQSFKYMRTPKLFTDAPLPNNVRFQSIMDDYLSSLFWNIPQDKDIEQLVLELTVVAHGGPPSSSDDTVMSSIFLKNYLFKVNIAPFGCITFDNEAMRNIYMECLSNLLSNYDLHEMTFDDDKGMCFDILVDYVQSKIKSNSGINLCAKIVNQQIIDAYRTTPELYFKNSELTFDGCISYKKKKHEVSEYNHTTNRQYSFLDNEVRGPGQSPAPGYIVCDVKYVSKKDKKLKVLTPKRFIMMMDGNACLPDGRCVENPGESIYASDILEPFFKHIRIMLNLSGYSEVEIENLLLYLMLFWYDTSCGGGATCLTTTNSGTVKHFGGRKNKNKKTKNKKTKNKKNKYKYK